jgi:RNA polymerase sigma-70 factor, ECF subfamily
MDERRRDRLRRDLARLADGDRAAFDPVFEAAWPLVRSFATRALASDADAEDCAQHVLLRVFARAGEYDPERDALSWIFAIAAWEVRTIRKRRQRRRESFGEQDHRTDDGFECAVIDRELRDALFTVIEEMKTEDRDTLLAAVAEGPRPPIAGATFRKRFQRALDRLKSAWSIKHGTE